MKIEECEECGIKKDDVDEMLIIGEELSFGSMQEVEVYKFLCHDCYDLICDENG